MKIRIMGTREKLACARMYYEELERSHGVKSVTISRLYPNRGSNTIYRLYVDVEYYVAAGQGGKAGSDDRSEIAVYLHGVPAQV